MSRRLWWLPFVALVALVAGGSNSSTANAGHAGFADVRRAGSAIQRVLGYSIEHRPIVATLKGVEHAARVVLVVGSIAGDEPGGTAVARALAALPAVRGVQLWLIPDMNPDGAARGTRGNAGGVDLNRNFPFHWRSVDGRGSRYYPGKRPASEPESRAVEAFIERIRPGLTVWLHQPYAMVDDSQGPRWAEQLLGHTLGLPLNRLPDYQGSAIGWEDHLIPRSAFDLELPGGPLGGPTVRRFAEAVRLLATTYASMDKGR